MRIAIALLFASGLTIPAANGQNNSLFDPTKGAPGVFDVQAGGTVKHLQSGLVCPAAFPNAAFYHLDVFAADGSDVGCDYRRADDKGGAWAKLTIFATKASDRTTTDDAFARYRKEVTDTYPDAQSNGDAVKVGRKNGQTDPLSAMRSEEFTMPFNNQTYTTQLFVMVCKGWMLEVRTSFVGAPNEISANREGAASAAAEMGDRLMGINAMVHAMGSVCG